MKKKIKKTFVLLSLIISCICSFLLSYNTIVCSASIETDGVVYSDVLEDLQKDSNFNSNDYVVNKEDYSLSVIRVAESVNKELIVYVYQPCSPNEELTATTINISTQIEEDLSYKNYKLSLINSNGVFYKYKVRNFVVSEDSVRYYEISSIFRKWNAKYDESLPDYNENTISEVSFPVATRFTAFTDTDGNVSYSNNGIDVIYITDKYVGFIRYSNGFRFFNGSCDSHYVAFSTDRQIDKLLEADVYFISQEVSASISLILGTRYSYKDEIERYAYLKYTDVASNSPIGTKTYTWDRIESIEDFISNENLTEEGLEDLENKEWVLRFYESGYSYNTGTGGTAYENYTTVKDVTILRLKFQTDGIVYNLGAIDNKQTGDGVPDNVYEFELADWLKLIFLLLLIVVLIIVFEPILPALFNLIWRIIKTILKVAWWIVSLPFRLFKKKE